MVQHAAQFCADEYVEVTCGSGQTLNIQSAMYGRMSVGRYEHSDCIYYRVDMLETQTIQDHSYRGMNSGRYEFSYSS